MLNKKTVTPKQLAANRANARLSTGPRTKRGKRATRLNALKFGFFSEELVIPTCDGEGASEKYLYLLNAVNQELKPSGVLNTWWAEMVAETMWRFRRGTRAERGSSLVNFWDSRHYQKDSPWCGLVATAAAEAINLAVLNAAWKEIQQTGTLSKASYAKVAPLVGGLGQTAAKAPETEKVKESNLAGVAKAPKSDNANDNNPAVDSDFVRRLEEQRFLVQASFLSNSSELRNGLENAAAKSALPPSQDIDKILRYEARMRKRLDWALKGFYASRNRRAGRTS
jgi:hypothetical protein